MGREILSPSQRELEALLTRIRRPLGTTVDPAQAARARVLVAAGLADPRALDRGRVALTAAGRPVADAVVRRLVG